MRTGGDRGGESRGDCGVGAGAGAGAGSCDEDFGGEVGVVSSFHSDDFRAVAGRSSSEALSSSPIENLKYALESDSVMALIVLSRRERRGGEFGIILGGGDVGGVVIVEASDG